MSADLTGILKSQEFRKELKELKRSLKSIQLPKK